jgi:hypothetical protein
MPVLLRGHEACVWMPRAPSIPGNLRLRLGWADGTQTELAARVRAVESSGCVLHFDVLGVDGDWQPFLAYLGQDPAVAGDT